MLVCEACGSENPDDVHFCVMCGAFLAKPEAALPAVELPPLGDAPVVAPSPTDGGGPTSTARLPGLPTGQAGLTARPPQRGQPTRGAAAATTPTRPQQALAMVLDQPVVEVQPGATASF